MTRSLPRSGRRRRGRTVVLLLAAAAALLVGAPGARAAGLPPPPPDTPAAEPEPGPLPHAPSARPTPPAPADPGQSPAGGPEQTPTPGPGTQPTRTDRGGGLFGWFDPGGWVDVEGRIDDAVNGWFNGLAGAALDPVLHTLATTVLSTPDVTADQRVVDLWRGSAVIANSLFLLLLTVGGLAVTGHGTVQHQATAKELAPRAVTAFLAANLSLPLLGFAVRLANSLSVAVAGQGVDADGTAQTFSRLLAVGAGPVYLVLLVLVFLGTALALTLTCVVRTTVLTALAVAAPLLLVWHALPWTDGAARLWWRAVAGCLAVQVGQTLLLLLGVRVLLSADGEAGLLASTSDAILNVLVCTALLYTCVRLQGWVSRLVLHGAQTRSVVVTLVKYRLLRKALAAAGLF